MWSIGVITYAVLTGRPLYTGDSHVVQQKIRASRAEDHFCEGFASLSTDARDFIRSLLASDPTQRLSAAEALRHPWVHNHTTGPPVKVAHDITQRLHAFAGMSSVRRIYLATMAWSLPKAA